MTDKNNARQAIMDVVIKLVKEHSFDEASIDEICAKASLTKGAFYYYFKSKDDVVGQYIVEQIKTIDSERNEKLINIMISEDCFDQLMMLFSPLCDMCNRVGVEILQISISRLADQYYTSLIGRDHEGNAIITHLIDKGQKQGVFRNKKSASMLCEIMNDMLFGMVFYWCHHDAPFELKEKVAESVAGLLDYSTV
ncbi:MAG: TetR/AcrR family transcriptional regulator [Chloroflexi bacterium]|nr:TetR/AcrR family transcriptional regulator [Chloroflexota bacterium]